MPDERALFSFSVLVEWDQSYKVYVARCLETGSVATGDDSETAKQRMRELLCEEVVHLLKTSNVANLFSSPSPLPKWLQFREEATRNRPVVERQSVTTPDLGHIPFKVVLVTKTKEING